METILIVPGLHDSGPGHWQTWIENELPHTRRVRQDDWERPELSRWSKRVEETIADATDDIWIIAHSFGCLASVAAALKDPGRIRGAFLVAPADPARFGECTLPLEGRLPFPSLVVTSSNDPWVKPTSAWHWANQWGSDFANIGEAGHINIDSGHGPWPEGLKMLKAFRARAGLLRPAKPAPRSKPVLNGGALESYSLQGG